jgi:hypothetical protein
MTVWRINFSLFIFVVSQQAQWLTIWGFPKTMGFPFVFYK